ncbi:LysE/ArgO family amino acid transporter [Paracoccus zeaxanthinifaciens]|uniref:LysE/ArgO family amino acid transporter n=1 Tax=Paracoccus zeaxanthinifaciens TaxID=187400 RepID=UPI0003B60507|nr:LysE/ArgO family amino acid transporter [Paracoccus zeaxanthinifaciens]
MLASYFGGLGTGISLIAAIGAQNAFVLRQGILRRHVLPVVLFCALSDAVLIALGVAGMGGILQHAPALASAMRWGGVIFLLAYGARSLVSAIRGGAALRPEGEDRGLWGAMAVIAALTWLNPHVWLDTVLLLGGISAQWPRPWVFGLGAMTGSLVFFLLLGHGARYLAPVFARPVAWRVLDTLVALLMWSIAWKLISDA